MLLQEFLYLYTKSLSFEESHVSSNPFQICRGLLLSVSCIDGALDSGVRLTSGGLLLLGLLNSRKFLQTSQCPEGTFHMQTNQQEPTPPP